MYEKFGEFDNVTTLNQKAAELKEAGKEKELKELAKENGIDDADVEDYLDGTIDELATPILAAIGKIAVECKEYKVESMVRDWITDLEQEVIEHEQLAIAVKRKDKSISGFIAAIIEYSYKHSVTIDKRIVDLCPEVKKSMGNHPLTLGGSDRRACKRLIYEYYLGRQS